MKIWAHTLVKNEDRYLWFSVNSVIDYVDKMLLWDTGSTDSTSKIIEELLKLYPDKISYEEVGKVDINEFTSVRAEMLKKTEGDWLLLVDGDEVWWQDTIESLAGQVRTNGRDLDSIVVGYYNLLGDIFHYDSEKNGSYQIDDVRGNITIRAINMGIPGLKVDKPHGQQGFFDASGTLIQSLDRKRRKFMGGKSYMHFTHLSRSTGADFKVPKRLQKQRKEIGEPFPLDFYYPEVFFKPKPGFIVSPWETAPYSYNFSRLLLPAKSIKRALYSGSGY